jgi:hypothetical protein
MAQQDDENTAFPASAATPGQADSRRARHAFLQNAKDCPWLQDYLQLRLEGWDWRKAAYIAWKASPLDGRAPKTQQELATDVLGLRSDRAIRNWIEKDPAIEERVARLQIEPLFQHRRDVINTLIESAKAAGREGAADRKLYFTLTGDLKTGKGEGETTPGRQAPGSSPFEGVSDDELERIIRNLQAAVGDAGAEPESEESD